MNSFTYSLPTDLQAAFDAEASEWKQNGTVARIWSHDASVWTGGDEANWLGWLDIVEEEARNAARYDEIRADIESGDFTDVLLMGMGGSSLCPEVLAVTFGRSHFHILDSTVPAQVAATEARIDPAKTLFIVASKSGSTLEPNCFKQYFFNKVASAVGRENAGKHFIAVTDPGSKMEQAAKADAFRHIVYGKPEIGGRFSALSAFGMTAAAAMGLDVGSFLEKTQPMVDACRRDQDNPGEILGLILGLCQRHGRDKLTIVTSPEVYDLGAWLEQLVAESTGKNGVAIVPVDREPEAESYSDDRVFAFLSLKGDDGIAARYDRIVQAGHAAVRVELESIDTLGQEFFRWEFATAVAGSVMGINPFDQPDVESAKIEARKLTDEYEEKGELPVETPFFSGDGIELFAESEYAEKLGSSIVEKTAASLITAHLDQIKPGDYFATLAYVEMNSVHEDILQAIRSKVLSRYGVATCLGFGPRFLHSTGQAYKGGGNNGLFLQITSDDDADVAIPGQKYTFGVVRSAQARGDFQVLMDRRRRCLRVHLGAAVTEELKRLEAMI